MKKRILATLLLLSALTHAEKSLSQVHADYQKTRRIFIEQYQKATTKEERQASLEKRPSSADYLKEATPFLLARAENPEVVKDIAQLLLATRTQGCEELIPLLAKHRASEHLSGVLLFSNHDKSGELIKLRDWARENSPHPSVQAVAAFFIGSQSEKLSDEEKLAELKFANAYEGELKVLNFDIKERITPLLYEAESLSIGNAAPEIVGQDLDGETFKLSDYKGKVVALDFWGDW